MPGVDAGVLETAALVASVAGTAVSAYGAYQSGQAQSKAAAYQAQVAANNAKIAQEQASLATQKGEQDAMQQGLRNRAALGGIVTSMAANGVDVSSGSAANVRQSADILGMQDVQTKRENAAIEAYGFRSQGSAFTAQSQLDTSEAQWAKNAGFTGAAGTLLGGVGSVGSKYADWLNQKGTGTKSSGSNDAYYAAYGAYGDPYGP